MSDSNPIVRDTVKDTLSEVINSLQYLNTTLPCLDADDGNDIIELTAADLAGLANMIGCIRVASEACYAQYCQERRHCKG